MVEGTVSRDELFREVWGEQGDPKAVDVTVCRLRRDLEAARGVRVETTRHGYELVVRAG